MLESKKPKDKLLFLVPPNIEFDDFVNPPKNISTIRKGDKLFGSLITDIPLGIISLSAYIKKHFPVETSAIDFNVELIKKKNLTTKHSRNILNKLYFKVGKKILIQQSWEFLLYLPRHIRAF